MQIRFATVSEADRDLVMCDALVSERIMQMLDFVQCSLCVINTLRGVRCFLYGMVFETRSTMSSTVMDDH